MSDPIATLALQKLVARFANSFDLKDWDGLPDFLDNSAHADYSDLRGTPHETLSSEQFVPMTVAIVRRSWDPLFHP